MIHVNARAIVIQIIDNETQILIQKRYKHGEPSVTNFQEEELKNMNH